VKARRHILVEMDADVIVVGSGNAALCAALAALDSGASVLLVDKADAALAGGNSRYTAGAMRFAYSGRDDLVGLLTDPDDPRLVDAEFGSYDEAMFLADLVSFNEGAPATAEQRVLVDESFDTVRWLAAHDVTFEPIWDRQAYIVDGRHVFWGGLTLAADGEGSGLVDSEMSAVFAAGGSILLETEVTGLVIGGGSVVGVQVSDAAGSHTLSSSAVVLACGGFEADPDQRVAHLGEHWKEAKVRGTPHNTGAGLRLARDAGAAAHGRYDACHATPMDLHMADFGNLDLPHVERKNYRKICYFLGVMLNAEGDRFVDEGRDFRNYTYAQFGAAVLEQPGGFAWQVFDSKIEPYLYEEYRFHDASFIEADSLEELVVRLDGVDQDRALHTVREFNRAVDRDMSFDPSIKDGKAARSVTPPKSNWAQTIDMPPFRAFPVTGGITFTYGGLHVGGEGEVLRGDGTAIGGLFACGELVGGVFLGGYPGGSGLTSGAVFGRRAGEGAARGAGLPRNGFP